MAFVHLHVHSEYSMLDGLGPVKQIAKRAKDLGHGAVALTDHGVMYGAIEFFDACNDNGVKPIIGMEGYMTKRGRRMKDRDIQFDKSPYHMLMLAMNNTGYKNLMRMSSLAQLEGFYFKPRIDHALLKECNEGIICTSGCLGSEIPRLIVAGQMDEARAAAKWFRDIFDDRFYFELQEHDLEECRIVNPILVDWAKEMSIPLIVTSDAHYVKREDAIPHDLMLCIQTASLVSQKDRMRFNNDSYYMHTEAEMRAIFDAMAPEAVSTTAVIAERCSVSLKTKNFYLPNFRSPQMFANDDAYLRYLCEIGFEVRYGIPARADGTWVSDDRSLAMTAGGMPEAMMAMARKLHGVMFTDEETPIKLAKLSPLALSSAESNPNMSPRRLRERLDFELNTITTMGFSKYMLIVWDLIRFCRESDIWWDVRGSAAGSMVSHVLMLTNIEPVSNDLFFERFLNPERVTMPDIDMDFPDDQRHLLVDYTIDKYGKENVAQIITFGTMAARGALKDVGRVMDVPLSDVNRVTSLVPAVPGKPVNLRQAREEVQALKELLSAEPRLNEMYEKAITIEGRVRNAGTHAAGVVIADRPLIEYVPLNRLTGTPLTSQLNAVTQFEMGHLEAIGLLKMDYLGLSMLTIIRRAANMIAQRHGIKFDMNTIPIHDKAIYELLSRGDVLGVFQVEGSGMKKLMTEMRPVRYENIVAAVSLFRPGPMEYIPAYNRRLHGEEPVTYHHPDLARVFGETYGICVSGDAIVFDPMTGMRCRLDEVQHFNEFHIQGVDQDLSPKVARVTHWISKGCKPVYKVRLRNGSNIKITHDHRVLTEAGWQPLSDLSAGEYIATPKQLIGPQKQFSLEKLRILAYLLSDGDIGNLAAVNFVSKDPALLDEYKRCLSVFPNIRATTTPQIREVQRIGVAKEDATDYHAPNTLLTWLRDLKLKNPAGTDIGGCRSHEKFVPAFIFELGETEIAFFVASLWDCDGYFGTKLCHYKTISEKLANDVRTLLLRLGIRSVTYSNEYESIDRTTGAKIVRTAYQITVYDTQRLTTLLKPHLISQKRFIVCTGRDESATLNRAHFVAEVRRNTQMSHRQLMAQYGIDRQHFLPKQVARPRIGACVVADIAKALALPETQQQLNVTWEEIISIELCGEENVYDLTVEGIHNFVADNIIVHNCVYQEQIMSVARDFAGYSMGEADTIRKAVSKKNAEQLAKHKSKFRAGAEKKGYPGEVADAIWADIEFFARYGFNKSHAAIYASITCQTAYLKAKFPTEYLTSLMTAEAGASEKMAALIADAKSHGIDVLPPSVNFSVADFGIQDFKEDARTKNQEPRRKNTDQHKSEIVNRKSAIRFGLTAIKNVGTGPIEAILKARGMLDENGKLPKFKIEDKPFKTLDDFCRRVDMTQFNKRALECLIKAGALDEFGPRPQLLAVMDQMIGMASVERKAAEQGQNMLFGMLGGGDEAEDDSTMIVFPKNVKDIPKREMLTWEKELIGTYVSDHPLTAVMASLQSVVSHNAIQLDESANQQSVCVAGVIQSIRPHTSKSGKQMAFGVLEDVTGTVELTVFPKAYEQCQALLQPDKVVVVYGKCEFREGRGAQILVDKVTDSVDVAKATDVHSFQPAGYYIDMPEMPEISNATLPTPHPKPSPIPQYNDAPASPRILANDDDDDLVEPEGFWEPQATEDSVVAPRPAPLIQPQKTAIFANTVEEYAGDGHWSTNPPAPPSANGAAKTNGVNGKHTNGIVKEATVNQNTSPKTISPNYLGPKPTPTITVKEASAAYYVNEIEVERTIANGKVSEQSTVLIAIPPAKTATPKPKLPTGPLMVNITRTGSTKMDIERLQAVHSTLLYFQGTQQFSIRLRSDASISGLASSGIKDLVIDFPNDGTRVCDELHDALRAIGAECVI